MRLEGKCSKVNHKSVEDGANCYMDAHGNLVMMEPLGSHAWHEVF